MLPKVKPPVAAGAGASVVELFAVLPKVKPPVAAGAGASVVELFVVLPKVKPPVGAGAGASLVEVFAVLPKVEPPVEAGAGAAGDELTVVVPKTNPPVEAGAGAGVVPEEKPNVRVGFEESFEVSFAGDFADLSPFGGAFLSASGLSVSFAFSSSCFLFLSSLPARLGFFSAQSLICAATYLRYEYMMDLSCRAFNCSPCIDLKSFWNFFSKSMARSWNSFF